MGALVGVIGAAMVGLQLWILTELRDIRLAQSSASARMTRIEDRIGRGGEQLA